MEEIIYEYWLSNAKGISADRKRALREQVSAEALYNMEETAQVLLSDKEKERIECSIKEKEWADEYQKCTAKGIIFCPYSQREYPECFRGLKGMPYGIYYKGKLPENGLAAAIVGARRCTSYGEKMTLQFAEALASQGIPIVSGMARGVDGIAHRGALNVGGMTIAVLGCGVDICYPREHIGLYRDIEINGCILSEYPPGTPPLPAHFPARNRIISAISEIVLVMEAKEKSGSLITADMALEQGKEVYALPGMIDSELSKGCNKLISEGAGILLGVGELYEELRIKPHFSVKFGEKNTEKSKIMLESREDIVYSCLRQAPKNREDILRETCLTPQELSSILVALELKGYIKERHGSFYAMTE